MGKNKFKNSNQLYKQAVRFIPGGVNSPVRAFKAVGKTPLFIAKAKGAKVFDEDKNSYIDYVMSWGALILGHSHPQVLNKVKQEAVKGTSFGAPTKKEVEFAKIICKAIPSIKKIRLVNSGTEATTSAIRLARGYTGKNKIIKFEGCYHGCTDSLLVSAGSGAATFGIPTSKGITTSLARDTIVCPYNDIDRFYKTVKTLHKQIACCIIEPICGNMGVVVPDKAFLSKLREITETYKILLIFDEVITGFRFCFGGVQQIFKITPDLTCLGKIIGGGFPIGAYGGKKEIMDCVAPCGGVYQAGTLSGNPVAVTAGLTTLKILSRNSYQALGQKTKKLTWEISKILEKAGIKFQINRFGSMYTVFFTNQKVTDYKTAKTSNTKKYASYFWKMINNGVNFAPSQFEANFISFSHKDNEIEKTLSAYRKFAGSVKK